LSRAFSGVSVKVSPATLGSILDGTISSWSDIPALDSMGEAVALPNESILVVRSSQASDQQWDDRFEQRMNRFRADFVYSKRSIEEPTNKAVVSAVYGTPWSIAVVPFTYVINSLARKMVLIVNGTDVSCTSDSIMSGEWPFAEYIDMAFPTTFVGEDCIGDRAVGIAFARFVYWFNEPCIMSAPTENEGMAYLPSDPSTLIQVLKARASVTCDGKVIMEPDHDLLTVSLAFKCAAYGLTSAVLIAAILLSFWLIKNRRHVIVRASTLAFMLQILLGIMMSVITIVFILKMIPVHMDLMLLPHQKKLNRF